MAYTFHRNQNEEGTCCCQHANASSVSQSLDEMDFERGVWNAALNGELDRVASYLDEGGCANAVDSSGYTALHYAARNGQFEVCRLLLIKGADVNCRTRSGGVSALHRAAYCGHHDTVALLLKHGADLTLKDFDEKTALHKAAEGNRAKVARMLLDNNSSLLDETDKRGKTAKDYVPASNTELIQILNR